MLLCTCFSASAASQAAFQRAALEEETEYILSELISTKMQFAALCEESDKLKKKLLQNRRRLQRYAEKLSSMEIASVVDRLEDDDDEP